MESWCELVSSYSDEPEPKNLAKALRTANTLISGDLAPFEIEWLVQTLFFKPVDVLNTIATKKSNEDWLKNIADSFKVISKLVCKYWNVLDKYHETIVKLCMLPYDAQTKKDAINCLNNILKNPGVDAGNAKRHIDALEGATTCKAPLAILVGNICRYCPEAINQEHNRIWRVYLNMLQHQNITDNVMNAILQGIDGLFENFGRDLPTAELNNFYSDLSRKCAKMPKCIEPLLSILKSRPGLFKEKLREDQVLRMYLWGINSPSVKDALLSVYTAIFELVAEEERRHIISTEIQPRINSESSLVKHTALRVAFQAKILHGVTIPNIYRPDALEFQIRRRMISHQEADLVSLCLESQESYVKSLLVTVIMYYDNIPVSLRQRIVVEGVTGTTDDIRRVAITLLIELCRQDGGLEKYAELWRCLLNSESVKQCYILEDTLKHIVLLIRTFLEAPVKDSDQMLSLSSVLSFILSVSETDRSSQHCELLRHVIVELASALCICPATLLTCKFVCVEIFKDDSLLKVLLYTFKDVKRDDSLSLMQEIFGKDTVEPKLQIRALTEMDSLLKSNNSLDYRRVPHIIKQILKLKFKRNVLTTDDRVLQRDLSLFMGEHGHLIPKESFTDDLYSLDLHNNINITIPNVVDGKNYKIDLLRILQITLMHEDFDALYCLLLIITVNLRDRPEPGIQNIVWQVVHAIFRSNGSVDAAPALRMCATAACVLQAIQSITEETNPEVRRQLCDGLEVILLQDPGSEKAGELLTMVADELVLMINSPDQPNYEAGLDITRIFLNTLRDNDSLAMSYLPQIITLLSKQISKELYKNATDIFIDKIDIFEDEKVNEIITGIVRNILFIDNKIHIEYVLEILKKVFELKDYDGLVLVREIFEVNLDTIRSDTEDIPDIKSLKFINALLILALAKPELEFSDEICDTVITTDDMIDKINVLLNKDTTVRVQQNICKFLNEYGVRLLESNKENLSFRELVLLRHGRHFANWARVQQNICKFLNEYGVRLLESNKEETLKCLSSLIENLSPTSLPIIKNDISACLCTYKTILTELPTEITNSYHKCCQKLNIENITEEIKRVFNMSDLFGTNDVSEEIADKIQALSIMVDIFDMAIPNTDIWTQMILDNQNRVRYTIASNLLSVSEKSLSKSNFENILKDDQNFVMEYMSVYFERVLRSDRIVMETSLFVDVLKYYVNNNTKYVEKHFDRMVDVIERVWPMFEELKFGSKLSLVLDILRLPKNPGLISPIKWMINAVTAVDTILDHKIKMITLLPKGDEYSPCYRHMAGTLPILLSEMVGDHAAVLRALLDSLANSGDLGLLEIVCTFAAADDARGWWDDAMDACMASLADRRDESIYDAAYKSCKERTGLGVCRRVFLPLLKHSSRIFCEEFMSKIIADVLSILKIGFKEPTNTEIYRERVLSQAKAFYILQVAIEKLPSKSLESGTINIKAGSQDPWYLVKVICMRGYASLSKPVQCPENASDRIREACLRLQCSAYNCLVTAICKRRPSQKQYAAVFGMTPWTNIVDPEVEYDFAPRAYWDDNKSRRSGRSEGQGTSGVGTTLTYTGTVRTRIFLTTLSENPLQYDMIPNEEEEEEFEEETPTGYDNHPLNKYGCLSAITTLLAHSSTLEHTDWLNTVAEGLNSNLPVNAKWTLAQAICNVEEDLESHASVLAPALIQLVAASPKTDGDRKLLNNLHIDILWTVIKWNIPELPSYSELSLCIQYLISTCIEYRSQEAVSRRLLNTLNTVLQMYGSKVDMDWSDLQTYCNDMPNTAFFLIPIFLRILKNRVTIPGLLDNILAKFDPKLWISTSRLPEVFGLALSLERFKDDFLAKFWQILGIVKTLNVSAYVKVLMYAQRGDSKCCNRQHFRIITDLASKVERPKCLSIIAVYLDSGVEEKSCSEVLETIGLKELLDGEYTVEAMKVVYGGLKFMDEEMKADIVNTVAYNCGNSSPAIRKQAFAVIIKVFQDLVTVEHEYSAKRRALQGTPILDALESPTSLHEVVMKEVSRGVFDKDEEISKLMRDGIELSLSKDMTVRYAELFYIIFYLARSYGVELSQCGHVLLELLFRDVKRHDQYSDVKLSDQPLAPSDVINIGYMTYGASNVMVGQKQKLGSQRRELDVQTPVGDIFEMFVQSAKRDSQICQDLCLKVLKCLQGQAPGGRFDLDSVMARLLADMLKEPPSSLTPFVLEASRIFLDSVNSIVGLKDSLSLLKRRVVNADALAYYNVLIEDLELRSKGRGLFDFRMKEELDIEMRDENLQFSIEGLTEVFGHLSNWDDLRIQDRDRIEKQLPPLMTGDVRFESCVKSYFEERHSNLDYNVWFNKMVGSYVSSKLGKTVLQFKENWLRDIERWPTRDFVTSAVIEAIKWPADDTVAVCDIRSSDCLAEWAARLMIRASYFDDNPRQRAACRVEELKFCSEANRRQLPALALQCIERNKGSLLEEEALPWFQENVRARRLMAIREHDTSKLQKALDAAESQDENTSICLKKLILQLRKDLEVLTKSKLDEILASINETAGRDHISPTKQDSDTLRSVYDIAMDHYDELWEADDTSIQAEIISGMATLIQNILDQNLAKDCNLLISMLLNRLAQFDGLLSEETAKKILDQIVVMLPSLDAYSTDHLKSISSVFPTNIWQSYSIEKEEPLGLCKEYLQLVCDPAYTLARYCEELSKDWSCWQTISSRIKSKFDSAYRGTDYISLNTIKKKLFALDNTDSRAREKQLKAITTELFKKLVKPVLRLSQLSPELSKDATLEGQRENLRKLLGLPASVYVVKFSEQIQVFVDAIRRPCVLSAVLSNGRTKKYIIKSGEVLANDASVQRAIAVLPKLFEGQVRSYNVTTLSEDCAIIEYLENYQRLQELMGDKVRIPVERLNNDKLVLSPSLALEQHNTLCNKIPVYTLRSSIEDRCASMQEFIAKKRMFTDTLAAMTISNWLFGVGDRHLHNIMMNRQDGGVCGVDMASVFEFGLRECVPARLTGNLLAVCDVEVLESRLQSMLICLRQSRKLYEAFIRISFCWKGRDFSEMTYIQNILQGSVVSYQVTRDVIEKSSIRNKQEYLNILDSVFENFVEKQSYSVEEQVFRLLQHCTDPKLLAITPRGWEAWV